MEDAELFLVFKGELVEDSLGPPGLYAAISIVPST